MVLLNFGMEMVASIQKGDIMADLKDAYFQNQDDSFGSW